MYQICGISHPHGLFEALHAHQPGPIHLEVPRPEDRLEDRPEERPNVFRIAPLRRDSKGQNIIRAMVRALLRVIPGMMDPE